MQILLTLDYELFFGEAGTVENCLIDPTNRMLDILDRYGVKASFFVDSGYLLKLEAFAPDYPALEHDQAAVKAQLLRLVEGGHDLQLHIHPHWEDSVFDGQQWQFDIKRYRLHDFTQEDIRRIVRDYKQALQALTPQEIFVFRAGGWCLQPFSALSEALYQNGIYVDSTVFRGGYNDSTTHHIDFREVEAEGSYWHFSDDPLVEEKGGRYLEMPISSTRVAPLFYWQFALNKKLLKGAHAPIGDGRAAATSQSKRNTLRMLTRPTHSVVSMDGYKAKLMQAAYLADKARARQREEAYPGFVVIGHPKAFSDYSLERLERFIHAVHQEANFVTYTQHPYLKEWRGRKGASPQDALPLGVL